MTWYAGILVYKKLYIAAFGYGFKQKPTNKHIVLDGDLEEGQKTAI
jgi:hypothetical protein